MTTRPPNTLCRAPTTIDGSQSFKLLQQDKDPQRFVSVGGWDSKEAIDRWRATPEFSEKLGAARALCDEFSGEDYAEVSEIT